MYNEENGKKCKFSLAQINSLWLGSYKVGKKNMNLLQQIDQFNFLTISSSHIMRLITFPLTTSSCIMLLVNTIKPDFD